MKKLTITILFALAFFIASAQQSERKIIELKKIISLSAAQEQQIRKLSDEYFTISDSILYHVQDPNTASQLNYTANKKYHEGVMNLLSDAQKVKYIRVTSTPEVNAKAEAKIQMLRESNKYSEAALDSMKNETFEYLMLEKVVYTRDRYKIRQQKDNIRKLKQYEPNSVKESNTREKLKAQGKVNRGNINW